MILHHPYPEVVKGRQLVWGYDFSNVNDISEVTDFHQNNNRNNFQNNTLYNPVKGGENWVIEKDNKTGENAMKLKVNYSNTATTGSKYDIPIAVTTKSEMSYKYGYLELVADIPFEYGIHVGLWLCPQDEYVDRGDDKVNAEVDVFESFGIYYKNIFSQQNAAPTTNLHKWYISNGSDATANFGVSGLKYNSDLFGDYSIDDRSYVMSLNNARKTLTYGFEWTEEFMAFYINGNCYFKVNISEGNNFYIDGEEHKYSQDMSCFHEELYVLFSIAVQSTDWTTEKNNANKYDPIQLSSDVDGSPDSIDFRIHSIKLYQNREAGETITFH